MYAHERKGESIMAKYEFKVKGKKVTSTEGMNDVVQILFILNRIASELAENNRILRRAYRTKRGEVLEDEA